MAWRPKTEGIDLVASYLWRTENIGKFEFVAAGNWNDTEVEKVPSTNVIDNICAGQPPGCTPPVLFARINTLSFEEGTPDSKVNLGIDWSMPIGGASFGVNLKGTRYGEVVEPGVPSTAEINAGLEDARDLHIQPDWIVDLALNTKLMDDKLGFALGVDNLFDQYPDRVPNARAIPAPVGRNGQPERHQRAGFSRYSPYGFGGRFVYARMSFNW